MLQKLSKAQSILDYIALIGMVSFALITMSGYLTKAARCRVSHIWADLYDPVMGVQ
jgi:hypothetical protein